ncbi:MAG: universal stress protein [Acidobacteria bacterium]|nr:universal stress protein [Acidobacteriota bacterium]
MNNHLRLDHKLSIIHVIHDGTRDPSSDRRHIDSVRGREAYRCLHELLNKIGCEADVRMAAGPLKETLLEIARQLAADVLIIGRKNRCGALGRLRGLTYDLVRDSPFPVLSV